MDRVSFYSAKEYDPILLKEIVEKIIADHGGYERLFAKGKKVVIKPNLVVKRSRRAVLPHTLRSSRRCSYVFSPTPRILPLRNARAAPIRKP